MVRMRAEGSTISLLKVSPTDLKRLATPNTHTVFIFTPPSYASTLIPAILIASLLIDSVFPTALLALPENKPSCVAAFGLTISRKFRA
jgi:hypothetical protein